MEAESRETLRIIDANLNRIGEGLRVLEELARLMLDDAALTQQLKDMRHKMVRADWSLRRQLLQARDSAGDVGVDIEASDEKGQRSLPETVSANSRRVQEALRVMEEMAKIPGINLDSDKYKQARFALYTIEKELLLKLLHQDKVPEADEIAGESKG